MSSDQTVQQPKKFRCLSNLFRPPLYKRGFLVVLSSLCFTSLVVYKKESLKENYKQILAEIVPVDTESQISPKFGPLPAKNSQSSSIDSQLPQKQKVDTSLSDSLKVPVRGFGDTQFRFPRYGNYVNILHKDLWTEKPPGVDPPDPNNPPLKKILFYNTAGGFVHYHFGFGREPFIRNNCPVDTCMTTMNRSRFPEEEFDAVIWQIRGGDISFPKKRSPHTRYIFWILECPFNAGRRIDPYQDTFNWTMTYRLDSDIPMPYGVVYRRKTPVPLPDFKPLLKSKRKHAVWFVSNCGAGDRLKLARELKENRLVVDIYGHCGTFQCARKGKDVTELYDECFQKVSKSYKFYLAFENSLCTDYVSEKLFNALIFDMVPVVFGMANYKKVAPPHSYIDALDFKNPKHLADYLHYLHKNDTAYLEYFEWKRYHHPPIRAPRDVTPYCELCARLHNDQKEKVVDLHQWWWEQGHCKKSWTDGKMFHSTWKLIEETAKQDL